MMHEYGALLPAVRIEDEPDLPVRGYYLDEKKKARGRALKRIWFCIELVHVSCVEKRRARSRELKQNCNT